MHRVPLSVCPAEILQVLLEKPDKRVSQGNQLSKKIEIGNRSQNNAQQDICQSL